ncbi:integumentary mucin C.1-like [Cebidichthys violaceus]
MTAAPTTAGPTTAALTTAAPTTAASTTVALTTASPMTAAPTTAAPTTGSTTIAAPTTTTPTTAALTTATPTAAPTTAAAMTAAPATNGTLTTIGRSSTTTQAAMFVVLSATLSEPFELELNDPNSTQFQQLAATVVAVLDVIYRNIFGQLFIRSFVIVFRPAQARTRMTTTEAEIGIEFNQTALAAEIPQADVVAQTLVDAVSNPNNTFNLTFDPASIVVVQRNSSSNSTTPSPTLNTTATANTTTTPTTSATTTTPTTSATTTTPTTSATTTTPTTTTSVMATTPTAEEVIIRVLIFTSVGETFTSDLQNPSSAAFQSRAILLKLSLEPFYRREFPTFRALTVISFRSGSIINNMTLGFSSTFVPDGTQIGNVLVIAASNITAFNIDTTSISVDGIQVSSGVSHKISLITASFLVLLSWLLSSQQ